MVVIYLMTDRHGKAIKVAVGEKGTEKKEEPVRKIGGRTHRKQGWIDQGRFQDIQEIFNKIEEVSSQFVHMTVN